MNKSHTVTCHECGTIHVCPGPTLPRLEINPDIVRNFLKYTRIFHFSVTPLIDDWTEITINKQADKWYVNKEYAPKIMRLLQDALIHPWT